MAECTVYEPLLHRMLDGEATPEERERAQAHLAACPACREKYRQLEALRGAFLALDTEVPAGLTAGVMERVRAESGARRRETNRRWSRNLLALAACCAIVFLGVRGIGGGRDDASQEISGGAAPQYELFTAADSAAADGGDGAAVPENGGLGPKAAVADGAESPQPFDVPQEALGDDAAGGAAEGQAVPVETDEPAVGRWLAEHRPGETGPVALTAEEAADLADFLAAEGVDLALPEGSPVLLTYLG